jgi:hypothetical protein
MDMRRIMQIASVVFGVVIAAGCVKLREASDGWTETWQVPSHIWKREQEELERPDRAPRRLRDTSEAHLLPRVFRGVNGNFRICWIEKDPRRDAYYYELHEFNAHGDLIYGAGRSGIPSKSQDPDPRKIQNWNDLSIPVSSGRDWKAEPQGGGYSAPATRSSNPTR